MITKMTRNTDGLRIHLFVHFLLKTHIKIRVEIRDSVTAVIKFIIKIKCVREWSESSSFYTVLYAIKC